MIINPEIFSAMSTLFNFVLNSYNFFSPCMQAFEGGQGWVNAILYIFLSKEMRKKLTITLTRRTLPLHQTLVPTVEVTSTKVTRPSYTYYSMPEDTS